MRKRFRMLLFRLVVIAGCVAILEGLCSAFSWMRYGTISVLSLEQSEASNVESFDIDGQGMAHFSYPHPYLGWVNNENADRPGQRLNNVGLSGRDFPLHRDPAKFTILITGGSVAQALAGTHNGEMLESAFAKYDFGRPVVVLNGANGAWHQPHQAIATMLFGDIADAVVTLDGFNEGVRVRDRERIEYPSVRFNAINPLVTGTFDNLGKAWQIGRLRSLEVNSHSRACYFLGRMVRKGLATQMKDVAGQVTCESLFALPPDWNESTRVDFNIEQLAKYVRLTHASAGELGLKEAHLVQPCPAIQKTLTADELRVVGDLGYRDAYMKMERALLLLNQRGIPVASLSDCFSATPETIYVDTIHCNPLGYRLMAERIARELAKLWHVPEKKQEQ